MIVIHIFISFNFVPFHHCRIVKIDLHKVSFLLMITIKRPEIKEKIYQIIFIVQWWNNVTYCPNSAQLAQFNLTYIKYYLTSPLNQTKTQRPLQLNLLQVNIYWNLVTSFKKFFNPHDSSKVALLSLLRLCMRKSEDFQAHSHFPFFSVKN